MENILCEECNAQTASLHCCDCEQLFCTDCDSVIHQNGTRKFHTRGSHLSQLSQKFSEFDFPALEGHTKTPSPKKFANQHTVGIFWDLFNCTLNLKILQETALLLKSRFGENLKIRVYGDQYFYLFTQLKSTDYEFRLNQDIPETALLIQDIRSLSNGNKKNVLISCRAALFKAELGKIDVSGFKVIKNPCDVAEVSLANLVGGNVNGVWERGSVRRKMAVSENSLDISMISFLKNLAYEGKIMHEFKELKEKIAFHLKTSTIYASELIQTGCRLGKLLHQTKKLGNFDVSIISLKVEKLNTKVLLWILRSLRCDEMISTEKAIQSRAKEAFDLKIPATSWSYFLESALKPAYSHKKSLSEAPSFSLFSSQAEKNRKNLFFSMKKVKDYGSGSENSVIYPVNEEWVSYDQYIKSGDVFQIKKTYEWKAFMSFFTELYRNEYTEDKAICGGRYGCAQYLKKFSESLKNSSLGKLSYMVQLAIDEDILRYHKTLLVWAPAFDKKCKEDKRALLRAKRVVVDAVASCAEGISLAQLPGLLKERMLSEIELSSLGFAKLKDLIVEIPDIELTLKGKNHPFVKIRRMKNATFEGIVAVVNMKMIENGNKLLVIDAEIAVAEEFGYGYRWNWMKTRNFEEFLNTCGEFVIVDKKFIERKMLINEKYHSYTSSTTSEGYSNHTNPELFGEDDRVKEDRDVFQLKFIEDLLNDEDEYSQQVC